MKSWLFIGGPIILFTCFSLYSDLLTFGDQHPGVVHVGGVGPGGTFGLIQHEETYLCDETGGSCVLVDEETSFSEVSDLELEEQPIEYRDGLSGEYNKTKQPGIAKYGNIYLRRGSFGSFNWESWKFEFERQAEIEEINMKYDEKIKEVRGDAE